MWEPFWNAIYPAVLALIGLTAIFGSIAFFHREYQRFLLPVRHEWLTLLSREEWRKSEDIRSEMRKRAGMRIGTFEMIDDDMSDLIEAKLAEGRYLPHPIPFLRRYEYRLTAKGEQRARHLIPRTTALTASA